MKSIVNEKKTEVVTVRFTPSVKKRLNKLAQAGFRTISQEIEMRVIKSLGNSEKD
jgi:predicted transcriptional regulator